MGASHEKWVGERARNPGVPVVCVVPDHSVMPFPGVTTNPKVGTPLATRLLLR